MGELNGQISIFEAMDDYIAPTFSPSEMAGGVKAWVIEVILCRLAEDRGKADRVEIRPRQVRARTVDMGSGKGVYLDVETCDGLPYSGFYRNLYESDVFFKRRPSWADMLRWWKTDAGEHWHGLAEATAEIVEWQPERDGEA